MGVRRCNTFIERSIRGALSFLKETVFADACASKNGFLQSLDPRMKTVSVFLIIVLILFLRNILLLMCLYVLCLFLAAVSRIRMGFFLKRTWIFIPLFSLCIAIPALFSFFTPGEPLLTARVAGIALVITRQGASGAALFLARVITSVSFVVLLSITTRHFVLLRVLRVLRIPRIFVMTLGMCYRYIHLFIQILENTCLAIKSRTGTGIHFKKGQHIVSWNIAYLWMRSYRFNEAVYSAMLSRGYAGEPVVLDGFRMRMRDYVWLTGAALVFLLLLYCDRRILS